MLQNEHIGLAIAETSPPAFVVLWLHTLPLQCQDVSFKAQARIFDEPRDPAERSHPIAVLRERPLSLVSLVKAFNQGRHRPRPTQPRNLLTCRQSSGEKIANVLAFARSSTRPRRPRRFSRGGDELGVPAPRHAGRADRAPRRARRRRDRPAAQAGTHSDQNFGQFW